MFTRLFMVTGILVGLLAAPSLFAADEAAPQGLPGGGNDAAVGSAKPVEQSAPTPEKKTKKAKRNRKAKKQQ